MKKMILAVSCCMLFVFGQAQDSMNKKMDNKTDKMNKKMDNTMDPMNKKLHNGPDSTRGVLTVKSDSLQRKLKRKAPR
jgi:hypothetical protein